MIVDPQNRGMMRRVGAIKTAAIELKIEFESIPVRDKEALLSELVALTNALPDALMVLSPIYAAYGKKILDFAMKKKVPICCDTIGLARHPVSSCPMALTFQIYFAGLPFSWTRY
jgi:hypothetical protein